MLSYFTIHRRDFLSFIVKFIRQNLTNVWNSSCFTSIFLTIWPRLETELSKVVSLRSIESNLFSLRTMPSIFLFVNVYCLNNSSSFSRMSASTRGVDDFISESSQWTTYKTSFAFEIASLSISSPMTTLSRLRLWALWALISRLVSLFVLLQVFLFFTSFSHFFPFSTRKH